MEQFLNLQLAFLKDIKKEIEADGLIATLDEAIIRVQEKDNLGLNAEEEHKAKLPEGEEVIH